MPSRGRLPHRPGYVMLLLIQMQNCVIWKFYQLKHNEKNKTNHTNLCAVSYSVHSFAPPKCCPCIITLRCSSYFIHHLADQGEVKNTTYCYQAYNSRGICQKADVQIIYLSGCFSAAGTRNSAFTPRATPSLCYRVKYHLSSVIDCCGADVVAEGIDVQQMEKLTTWRQSSLLRLQVKETQTAVNLSWCKLTVESRWTSD